MFYNLLSLHFVFISLINSYVGKEYVKEEVNINFKNLKKLM
jgi:hypothetical protein